MLVCQARAGGRVWGRMSTHFLGYETAKTRRSNTESIDLRAGIFGGEWFSNFLSWGSFHIKCLYVKQMSKKYPCAFACGPSVVVKAQGWGQMQVPLHRPLGRSWLRAAAWYCPPHPPFPRVRTGSADMAAEENSGHEVLPPSHPDHCQRRTLPMPRGLLAVPGWLVTVGATAALEECGCSSSEHFAKITWC